MEKLMGEGKEAEALSLIRQCLEAPWAEHQKVWCVRGCWLVVVVGWWCGVGDRPQNGKAGALLSIHTCAQTHTSLTPSIPCNTNQNHRDEDIYWKLRLLSYICKRRTQAKERRLPPPSAEAPAPTKVRMACLVFRRSSGRLPRSLEAVDNNGGNGGDVGEEVMEECGMELR